MSIDHIEDVTLRLIVAILSGDRAIQWVRRTERRDGNGDQTHCFELRDSGGVPVFRRMANAIENLHRIAMGNQGLDPVERAMLFEALMLHYGKCADEAIAKLSPAQMQRYNGMRNGGADILPSVKRGTQ
jgi:hypothetical protein